ncbi:YlaH-like family protein [Ectobacillus ponti]|uniref:YlaH-like family protein n=1 Tax=Ectobacillus ponti TaxID=2961894 RepID=A0AA41X7L0_9BACI|nr:YlaH-like family protein [Ectobacillus ponti]
MLNRMTFFGKLFRVDENPETGMWMLYAAVVVLSIIVYNLGFARKLPVLQTVIVYVLLLAGCTVLTFFAVFLPVAEGLVAAAIVLGIYKLRLHQSKKQRAEGGM